MSLTSEDPKVYTTKMAYKYLLENKISQEKINDIFYQYGDGSKLFLLREDLKKSK